MQHLNWDGHLVSLGRNQLTVPSVLNTMLRVGETSTFVALMNLQPEFKGKGNDSESFINWYAWHLTGCGDADPHNSLKSASSA